MVRNIVGVSNYHSVSCFVNNGVVNSIMIDFDIWQKFGKFIIKKVPITSVAIVNKEPRYDNKTNSYQWFYQINNHNMRINYSEHELPTYYYVYEILETYQTTIRNTHNGICVSFNNLYDAKEYLSKACLLTTRQIA